MVGTLSLPQPRQLRNTPRSPHRPEGLLCLRQRRKPAGKWCFKFVYASHATLANEEEGEVNVAAAGKASEGGRGPQPDAGNLTELKYAPPDAYVNLLAIR